LFELPVLVEDRDHLVDQSLKLIVTGILAILLELTDQSLVIGASLPQEKSVKVKTARGLQLPFQLRLVRDLVSTLSNRCATEPFSECALLFWAIATTI
jgi:hypothetical protein